MLHLRGRVVRVPRVGHLFCSARHLGQGLGGVSGRQHQPGRVDVNDDFRFRTVVFGAVDAAHGEVVVRKREQRAVTDNPFLLLFSFGKTRERAHAHTVYKKGIRLAS